MDFRRIPFNFSTTDPLKRQEELQRRFGIPTNKGNMYVDFANPSSMSARSDAGSVSGSPRLQHRVPIFVEGKAEPTKPSVDAQNVDTGRKPHVRIVPIEIEGADNTYKRHRWLSDSSESSKERFDATSIPVETVKCPADPVSRSPKAPRVCNIPIKIEGSDHAVHPKSAVKTQQVEIPESPKPTQVKLNGCSASKAAKVNEQKESSEANGKKLTPEQVTLDKIKNVEEKLKGYHADVEKFSGTNKDKQYRYLDEMLTRCMLELDEIDTMGMDTIRLARKAAVKKVQASVDLLESKLIKESKPSPKEAMEAESSANVENISNLEEIESDKIEIADSLPEQINKKVENISIMEVADAVMQSDEIQPSSNDSKSEINENAELIESAQITEVETEADSTAASEMEPVIEEPLSDPIDETACDMDLDNCESDFKLDDPSVQICEVENSSDSNPNESSDPNLEMEVTEMSDIPVVTETNHNDQC